MSLDQTEPLLSNADLLRSIIQDCEDALTNWVEQNAAVKSNLSTRARTLSQRRHAGRRQPGEGVDLADQDHPLQSRDSGLWVPASQHRGDEYEEDDEEEEEAGETAVAANREDRGREEERTQTV